MTVFLEGDSIYHSKVLTFYRKEPFVLQVKYKDQKALPVSNFNIGIHVVVHHHFRHTIMFMYMCTCNVEHLRVLIYSTSCSEYTCMTDVCMLVK